MLAGRVRLAGCEEEGSPETLTGHGVVEAAKVWEIAEQSGQRCDLLRSA